MNCPDENEIVAFATGQVPAEALERIRSHIDGCEECSSLVAEAAEASPLEDVPFDSARTTPVAGAPSEPPIGAPQALPRGTTLGRYVVLDLLAAGGLGQVFIAYDPQLDRRVALKLLRPSSSGDQPDAEAQRWLLREAQAMAKLSHPNVVPVHDVGMLGGSVFVAMELIEGQTFTVWARSEPRPWQAVRDLLLDAAKGLMAAHEAGLIHRDFKPSNILVGNDGRVRVVDFGLARAVAGPSPLPPEPSMPPTPEAGLLDQSLTATGTIVGTPAFMSPEQFRGADVGFQADQFAFCVTLYFGLYGLRPFVGKDLKELQTAIFKGKVQDPPMDRVVPKWLHKAVVRGLRPDPSERFASMSELLSALSKDRRKRSVQWAAVGLSLIVSTAGASIATLVLQPEPTAAEKEQVEVITQRAREAAARSYFVYPPPEDPDYLTAYENVVMLESLEGGAAEAGEHAAKDLRVEFAEMLTELGDTYWDREGGEGFAADYYGAAALFRPDDARSRERMRLTPGQFATLQAKAAKSEFSPSELDVAQALVVLAEPDPKQRKRRVESLRAQRPLPATVQANIDTLVPTPAPAVAVAQPRARLGPETGAEPAEEPAGVPPKGAGAREAPGRTASEDAPSVRKADKAPRDPEAAQHELGLGRAAMAAGAPRKASKHFHRALEHDPRNSAAVGGLADAHFDLSEHASAARYGERAVALAPKNARYHLMLGDAYVRLLRYTDARRVYEKAKTLGAKKAEGRLKRLDAKTAP